MERAATTMLRIGNWCVHPATSQISRDGETVRLEARTMRLLLCLADHAGEVVSIDDLLDQVWPEVTVSPDSVYQAVASLRRLLGDDPKQPTYIATVPRLGYRMIATISPVTDPETAQPTRIADTSSSRKGGFTRSGSLWTAGAVLCLVLVALLLLHGRMASRHRAASTAVVPQSERSVAVLPLLDLTEGMKEEEFADGMTEELIDKLSKVPGLRVPSPTSSFYFKGKQIPIPDIARTLGVAYALDGSVRKSGARVRVAVRLIRADNGYIIWSETYDRPFNDILMVQDDIAGQVTKALNTSINPTPGQ